MSTSMPAEVQQVMLEAIPGLEAVRVLQWGVLRGLRRGGSYPVGAHVGGDGASRSLFSRTTQWHEWL